MKSNIGTLLILLFLLVACKSAKKRWFDNLNQFATVSDKDLKIIIGKLPLESDSGSLSYRVRIWRTNVNAPTPDARVTQNMLYHPDSCFYLQLAGHNIYPRACDAVNSGVAGGFEYLVDFDMQPLLNCTDILLVYDDKYLSNHQYKISLAK